MIKNFKMVTDMPVGGIEIDGSRTFEQRLMDGETIEIATWTEVNTGVDHPDSLWGWLRRVIEEEQKIDPGQPYITSYRRGDEEP